MAAKEVHPLKFYEDARVPPVAGSVDFGPTPTPVDPEAPPAAQYSAQSLPTGYAHSFKDWRKKHSMRLKDSPASEAEAGTVLAPAAGEPTPPDVSDSAPPTDDDAPPF